jgi:penicillin-binding protein 1A
MRAGPIAAATATVLAVVFALEGASAIAARSDEWALPLRIGTSRLGLRMDASVAALLRVATHPLAAGMLDGRSLSTGYGTLHFARVDADRLSVVCAPCRLRPPTPDAAALMAARVRVIASRREGALLGTLSVEAVEPPPQPSRIASARP